jgi:hypothetical protein
MSDDDLFEGLDEYEDEDVGLDEEDRKHVTSNRIPWFKGEKGKKYRVGLVYFNPVAISIAKAMKKKDPEVSKEKVLEAVKTVFSKRAGELGKSVDELQDHEKLDLNNVRFKKILAHYKQGVGYVLSRLGKDGADADAVWKMMGPLKVYFTTVLVVYPTNNSGSVIKEQLTTNSTVIPWRFSNRLYETLHEVANSLRENDLSISNQDLALTCTNTDYQNFDIHGAGKAIWRLNKDFQSHVLSQAHALYEKLVPFREMSTADLKIQLGLGGDAGEDVGADDFDGILDGV